MNQKFNKYLPVDYYDTFSLEVKNNKLSPKEIIQKIFGHNPVWLQLLYRLRTCLVKPFGIDTKVIETSVLIVEESNQEAVMRKDDKHLLFYAAVSIEQISDVIQNVQITTLVKYHNWIGRSYFFCIKPFHRIIVPCVLKRILQ